MTDKQLQNLTLVFEIPHISKLLIYRDNWHNSNVMRKVIAEVLRSGYYNHVYFGTKPDKCYQEKCKDVNNDSAIISVTMKDILAPANIGIITCKNFFIKELECSKNLFQFDNKWIEAQSNTSCINLTVQVQHVVQLDADVSAA